MINQNFNFLTGTDWRGPNTSIGHITLLVKDIVTCAERLGHSDQKLGQAFDKLGQILIDFYGDICASKL